MQSGVEYTNLDPPFAAVHPLPNRHVVHHIKYLFLMFGLSEVIQKGKQGVQGSEVEAAARGG